MRRRLIVGSIVALAGLATVCITFAGTGALQKDRAEVAAASTCDTKHCSANTHCCYGCTGSPICVKNGVPCPECAPQ
jgi:hypothetical protein